MKLEEIQKYIKQRLSEKRYYHSLCVMERSEEIAKMYNNTEIENVKKIGIAHDVAKEMTDVEKIKYVKENDIEIDEIERQNTGLLHAKIGADISKKVFGFTNEMAEAIENHTTGNINMNMYSKILFIADRTSKERKLDNKEEIEKLLDEDIDKAILFILDEKIKLQIKKGQLIHIRGVLARNEFLTKTSK